MRLRRQTPAARAAAGLLSLLVVASGCSSSRAHTPNAGGRISVVAAENFWGDIAAQVGGDRVDVTSVVSDPNADPHQYQSDPRDAAAVAGAGLVVENGAGYDDFMDQMMDASPTSSRRVVSVAKVLGVGGSNPNPHLWYWTARLPQVAAAIADQLSAVDPADQATFHSNALTFDSSLQPLEQTIATIRSRHYGAPVGYTERVAGYLVDAAGLRLASPATFAQSIEDGNDPSPQDAVAFEADLTGHKVQVLLYNSQVVDAETTHLRQLARSVGIPLVGVAETMPRGTHFQAWQLAQDRAVLEALGG